MEVNYLLENKIEALEDQLIGIMEVVNDVKKRIKSLEERDKSCFDDVKEIVKIQPIIDEIVVTNSDAINILKEEIKGIIKTKYLTNTKESSKKITCKYYNRGYCKKHNTCNYYHNKQICEKYLNGNRCNWKSCNFRHPKKCKYFKNAKQGCTFAEKCYYLHEFIENIENRDNIDNIDNIENVFKCVSCQNTYEDENSFIKHNINNQNLYFCLNCDYFVTNKEDIYKIGWTPNYRIIE